MTKDDVIEMVKQANLERFLQPNWDLLLEFEDLAKLAYAKGQADIQHLIDTLYAMYKQACEQRDLVMDQQRAMVAQMRGRIQ